MCLDLFPTKSICSVLACLMKDPALLEDSKVKLNREDFYAKGESTFYQIIFATISNLYQEGVTSLKPANIDEYLSSYASQYETFNQNDGIEFLYKLEAVANPESYERYASRVKKFALIRTIEAYGFSLEGIYEESEDEEENALLMNRFEQYSVDEIIRHYEEIVNDFASEFSIGYETVGGIAGENGLDLFESFKESPQYGVSTCGLLQNSIFRGQLLGSSMLRSASTNTFKSRTSLAEATDLAINRWYNWETNQWEKKGNGEKVLYITTEMEQEELEPTIWAYISGVKEENIRDYNLTLDEVEVVKEAITDLAETKNFYIEYVPKFDPSTINAIIKKYAVTKDVDYVFFDYIHLNFEIMMEIANKTRGMTTREDMMLSIFAAGLVEMSKEYGFHLSTSTQLNGEAIHAKKLDQNVLRGAKSMADKFTKACIMTRPTSEDEKVIENLMGQLKGVHRKKPNMIWHIYKNRHSKFKGKLYLHVDFDTMRMEDLFMTDDNDRLMDVPERTLVVEETTEHLKELPY